MYQRSICCCFVSRFCGLVEELMPRRLVIDDNGGGGSCPAAVASDRSRQQINPPIYWLTITTTTTTTTTTKTLYIVHVHIYFLLFPILFGEVALAATSFYPSICSSFITRVLLFLLSPTTLSLHPPHRIILLPVLAVCLCVLRWRLRLFSGRVGLFVVSGLASWI